MNQQVASLSKSGETALNSIFDNAFFSYMFWVFFAIVVFILLVILSRIVSNYLGNKFVSHSNIADAKYQDRVLQLVSDSIFYLGIIFSAFIAFQIVWFDVGLILGGISFGIWFAFREVLGNMIAGILVLNTKDLKLGDVISIEWSHNYFGRIEEITIRYTTIRTLDLRQVIVPNMEMISNPIKTYSSEELVKLKVKTVVHYDSDYELASKVMQESINSLTWIKEPQKTKIYATDILEHGMELTGIFLFDPNAGILFEYAVWEINNQISKAFQMNNIIIPYPHVVVTIDKNDQNLLKQIKLLKQQWGTVPSASATV
jgi:small conductance mechanosensitive channel